LTAADQVAALLPPRLRQLHGQFRQAMLFRGLFDPSTLLIDTVRFPYDRYVSVGKAAAPTNLSLVIRSHCNERCVMCHSMHVIEARHPGMSLAELETFIAHLGPKGKRPGVFLTGGEPFMRRDIIDVVRAFRDGGVQVGVVSNGTLINAERIKALVELNVAVVVLSLHGSREVHDRITQRKGSYDAVVESARALLRARTNTRVLFNCAITEFNAAHLADVARVGEEVGVDAVRFEHLNFVTPSELERQRDVWTTLGDTDASVGSYVTELANPQAFVGAVDALEREAFGVPVFVKPDLSSAERQSWYAGSGASGRHCTYPWRSVFVDANADVYPCGFMFFKVGNLLEEPMDAIWNGERMVRFRREVARGLFPACTRCCKL